ncbi:MAG: heme o synthase [Opitutales bacterium]
MSSTPTGSFSTGQVESASRGGARAIASELWTLTKPRLSLLAVITAVVGYFAGDPTSALAPFFWMLLGTSLAAGSCGALNQYLEREADSRMARTRTRPLPSGTLAPEVALVFGLVLGMCGVAMVAWGTNPLAAALTAATILSYLLVYTPLKPLTPWATLVGAVPGALPPLIGWAAANNTLGALGWILFGILFAWQIPHFLAIAWNHRKDYAKAGMPMASVTDPSGQSCAVLSLVFTGLLALISLLPPILGQASWFIYAPAAAYGAWIFLKPAWSFFRARTDNRDQPARRLFLASIAYLPLVLFALVADRWLMPWILA